MARKRYTEEQVVTILKEAAAGAKTDEICRKYGISEVTFYKWRNKFGGMTLPDAKKLRELEGENRKLKTMLADSMLEIRAIKDVLTKKW